MSRCNVDIFCSLFIVVSNSSVCLVTAFHCSSSNFLAKPYDFYREMLTKKEEKSLFLPRPALFFPTIVQ